MTAMWTRELWMRLAAISGFLSVAVGAFAAHGVTDPKAAEWLRLGAQYELVHALATMACALFMILGAARARFAAAFFLSGSVIFCGSLYAMALGAPRILGAVTPVGGMLFLIGWAVLAWSADGIDQDLRKARP
jgi:uncharacterized membrane protein YgdD (TMEM256/DUF423 family)